MRFLWQKGQYSQVSWNHTDSSRHFRLDYLILYTELIIKRLPEAEVSSGGRSSEVRFESLRNLSSLAK